MKILVILVLLAYSARSRAIEKNCDGVIIHNINHSEEILKIDITSPYQLAIDYNSNMLFFSYSNYDFDTTFKSSYINLKTNEFKIIEGINGGFANAIDRETNTVYLGGSDGLYKFDFETKKAQHINGTSHNIWQMFFKKNLYYSTYPEELVYVVKDGHAEMVPELLNTIALQVAIDNNDNIFFSNSTGLYVHEKAKNSISVLGDYYLNSITSDINGNLFFSTRDGIYSISDKNNKIEQLASIDNIYGVAVESDGNIIYAAGDSIIRLKPTKTQCATNEKPSIDVVKKS